MIQIPNRLNRTDKLDGDFGDEVPRPIGTKDHVQVVLPQGGPRWTEGRESISWNSFSGGSPVGACEREPAASRRQCGF